MNNKLEFATKMQTRTMDFAVQIVRFFAKLPKTDEARVPGKQLLRAGTSVGANYRAVCRAKSNADFIHKLGTVVEEADESAFWLELMGNAGIRSIATIQPLKTGQTNCFVFSQPRSMPPNATRDVNLHSLTHNSLIL